MTGILAILSGLAFGAILGAVFGFGASMTYEQVYGIQSGGSAMGGFFFIGPFGVIGGFLLGAGGYLHYNTGPKTFTSVLLWSGGIVLVLGLIGWVIPVFNKAGSRAAYNLELEFEVPAGSLKDYQDQYQFQWGYAGETKEEKADTNFYGYNCEGQSCVLKGAIQMSDNPSRRIALFAYNGTLQSFPIPLTGRVLAPTEWSPWQSGNQVRLRWMMRKAK